LFCWLKQCCFNTQGSLIWVCDYKSNLGLSVCIIQIRTKARAKR
jgi:hypothetical protein